MRRRCLQSIVLILVLNLMSIAGAHAQGIAWQERRTLQFSILYPPEAQATAETYAQFVDPIYEEVSALWGYRPPPPVILRIYPTMELYYAANPLAERVPGVVAHAHTGRREISIAIPQTASQSEEEIHNNVRHELTHIVAADLSGGRLTTPWQEGIAQYVEHPTEQLERKMELMRQLIAENRVLSWSELNQPGITYADPTVGYPESLTIVAFLVQRNGMQRFRSFVEAMQTSTGYRGALESVYGVSADVLERDWLAQLPQYVNTGYRSTSAGSTAQATVDLTESEHAVARGDYATAQRTLQALLPTIQAAGANDTLLRAQSLLARASVGVRASHLAEDAHGALIRGDYQTALTASNDGQSQFQSIGQTDQVAALSQYSTLAQRGLEAEGQLSDAGLMLRQFRIRVARDELTSAYTTFQELGDQPRAAQAFAALALISRGEHILAGVCMICGALLLALSIGRRYGERQLVLPFS